MKSPYDIIIRPIITEKVTRFKEKYNQVVFEVKPQANKKEIKECVEKIFNVKVEKVRTMIVRGKKRRVGVFEGRRPSWKKAIVTLRKGDKIEIFEGA